MKKYKRLGSSKLTKFGIYGLSNDGNINKKDQFFEKPNQEIAEVGIHREVVILGDLNGRTGRKKKMIK